MMTNLKLEKENIIKDIRNLFTLKEEQNYTAIKDVRNLFKQEKEAKAIKDWILRDIMNLFVHEKEEENFWSNNHIEYESNGDKNRTISVEE